MRSETPWSSHLLEAPLLNTVVSGLFPTYKLGGVHSDHRREHESVTEKLPGAPLSGGESQGRLLFQKQAPHTLALSQVLIFK